MVTIEPISSATTGKVEGRNITSVLTRLASSPWFSYLTILALQLQTMWGVWNSPRLGFGDTSGYFVVAEAFADHGLITNIVMSPLYTVFYGVIYALTDDIKLATWLHRILIATTAVTAALAVFRRLLPAPVAWALAAWWALSPIIYDTLYEVHLFGVLPLLSACLAALALPGSWGRGTALGILIFGGLFVRNELSVAALLFACACVGWEWSQRDGGRATGRPLVARLAAYVAPLLVTAAVGLWMQSRVPAGFDVDAVMDHRHRLNMAQVYSFGYGQRHPEWKLSPWLEYGSLMTDHFGVAEPSIGEMITRNPRATLEHFLWNLRLTPYGLQLLLFSATSGHLNPDYPAPPMGSRFALFASLLLLALWCAGGAALIRQWRPWWTGWIRARIALWTILFTTVPMAVSIILVQRPRPSYLFGLAALLMAITGMCVTALAYRAPARESPAPRWPRLVACWPLAAAALLLANALREPPYPAVAPPNSQIFEHVERLLPYRDLLSQPGTRLYIANHYMNLERFVCRAACTSPNYRWFGGKENELASYLANGGFNAIYAETYLMSQLEAQPGSSRPFVDYLPDHWRVAAGENNPSRWRLFYREPSPEKAPLSP